MVRVGVVPDGSLRFISYMTPGFPVSMFEAITAVLGADLELDQQRSGPAPGRDPFADGTADLGWICSTSFVDLGLRAARPTVQLAGVAWVPDDPDSDGRPVYFGDVVVAPGAAIESLDDLERHRIGCNDPVSLSGHHALRFALEQRGHDPDRFAELRFTGGHHASLDGVVGGTLDAAVVDSVVRIGRARHDPAVAGLRVVERLGPWPVQPLVARADLDEAHVSSLARRLVDANDHPVMRRELAAAALTEFVAVGPDHYHPVHRAMDAGGATSLG